MDQHPKLQITSNRQINFIARRRNQSVTPSPIRSNLKPYEKQKYLPVDVLLDSKLVITPKYKSVRQINFQNKIKKEDLQMNLVPSRRRSRSQKQVFFDESFLNEQIMKEKQKKEQQEKLRRSSKTRDSDIIRDSYLEYLRNKGSNQKMQKTQTKKKKKQKKDQCKCQIM